MRGGAIAPDRLPKPSPSRLSFDSPHVPPVEVRGKLDAEPQRTIDLPHEGRYVERERHCRTDLTSAGVDRTRAARHRLPPGNQSGFRPGPGSVYSLGGLLVLLA